MIAKTVLGNNLLGLGLFSHLNALWIGMLPRFEEVAILLYLAAMVLLVAGLAVEWRHPRNDGLFYVACATVALPLIGPLAALGMAYSRSLKNSDTPQKKGWISSVFALKIHPAALLVWMIALVIAGALVF